MLENSFRSTEWGIPALEARRIVSALSLSNAASIASNSNSRSLPKNSIVLPETLSVTLPSFAHQHGHLCQNVRIVVAEIGTLGFVFLITFGVYVA
jgi:hypothetical protein